MRPQREKHLVRMFYVLLPGTGGYTLGFQQFSNYLKLQKCHHELLPESCRQFLFHVLIRYNRTHVNEFDAKMNRRRIGIYIQTHILYVTYIMFTHMYVKHTYSFIPILCILKCFKA